MMRKNNSPEVEIRRATQDDIAALADLHFRAYHHRFFDKSACDICGTPYGAPLAMEHPCLSKGQDRAYFAGYWSKFSATMWNGSNGENICFVAERGDDLIAFVKGSSLPANLADFSLIEQPPSGHIGELGSIYVDPAQKLMGAGQQLMTAYALDLNNRGYNQMVTAAYHRNDSPRFFIKLGASIIGDCMIPNEYINYEESGHPIKIEEIKGTLMHWPPENFVTLCNADLNTLDEKRLQASPARETLSNMPKHTVPYGQNFG